MKKYLLFMLALLPVVFFTSCSSDDDSESNFTLDKTELTLFHGESYLLKVSRNSNIPTFISENNFIANVDANGKITGNCVGETVVLVKHKDISKQCKVKVIPKITFIPEPYLAFGDTYENVRNVITKELQDKITQIRELDKGFAVYLSIDNSTFIYVYSFKENKLSSVSIILNEKDYLRSGKSLINFISERFYPTSQTGSTQLVLTSPDKQTGVLVDLKDNVLFVYFTKFK